MRKGREAVRVQFGQGEGRGEAEGETRGIDRGQIVSGLPGHGRVHACNQMRLESHVPNVGVHTHPRIMHAHTCTHVRNISTCRVHRYVHICKCTRVHLCNSLTTHGYAHLNTRTHLCTHRCTLTCTHMPIERDM